MDFTSNFEFIFIEIYIYFLERQNIEIFTTKHMMCGVKLSCYVSKL